MALALTGTVAFAVTGGAAPPDVSIIPVVITGRSALEVAASASATTPTETAPPATTAATPTVAATAPARSATEARNASAARRSARARTVTAPVTVPTVIVVAPRPEADPVADGDDGDDGDHEVVIPGVRDDDDDDGHVESDGTRRTESHEDSEDSSEPTKNEGD